MRAEPNYYVERMDRIGGSRGTNIGAFQDGPRRIICGTGNGWEHVSVSRPDREPTWAEMDRIKRLFWRDDEVVMQLHVSDGRKVNVHRHCLNLWRPQSDQEIREERARWEAAGELWPYGDVAAVAAIPLPPAECV